MTWNNTRTCDEKVKFIGDWLKDEFKFTDLCKRYGISRKTGYKLIHRFELEGEKSLQEKSHARHHHPNQTSFDITEYIINSKYRYPKWGPEKLRNWLIRNHPEITWPAVSTMGDILKRHGLVKSKHYRKHVPPHSSPFLICDAPNVVWSADYKGQFRLGFNENYCYPLTVSDNYSRFLLGCDGLKSPSLNTTMHCFKRIFQEYGLPDAIRTDNGQPFAGTGIGGLTQLSI